MGPHLAVPLEAQPVSVVLELSDVADRTTAYEVGQLEDLSHGEHRAHRPAARVPPSGHRRGPAL
jgi:hypothetical protein